MDVSQARYTLLYFYKLAGARHISINFAYCSYCTTTERVVCGVDQKSNAIQTYPLTTVIWGGGSEPYRKPGIGFYDPFPNRNLVFGH